MKVVYITVPSFFDLEISLIRELSKLVEINVLLIIQPESMHSSAFSIQTLLHKPCVVPAIEYPGMEKYGAMIDLNIWNIAVNPDNSLLSCIKLDNLIKTFINELKPDIIHCTTACKTMSLMSLFIRNHHNVIYTLHDPIAHEKQNSIKKFISDIYLHSYRNLLILSEYHLPILEKIVPGKNVFLSRLGVYDFLTYYEKTENIYGKYILFTGRISSYKGVDILIKAFNKSNASKYGVKLIIAGKGKIDGITINDLNDNIILINSYIENDLLANLIRNCLFGVLPYRTATQSGVLMCYYAFNKPVVATSVGDLSISIKNEKTGILCNANDINDLAKAINNMLELNLDILSDNIRTEYSGNGIKSWMCIANNLYTTYRKIIGSYPVNEKHKIR